MELVSFSQEQLSTNPTQVAPSMLWQRGTTKFTVMDESVLKQMLAPAHDTKGDLILKKADHPKLTASLEDQQIEANVPSFFDWRLSRSECISAVQAQGECGSCYAFASAAMLAERDCI